MAADAASSGALRVLLAHNKRSSATITVSDSNTCFILAKVVVYNKFQPSALPVRRRWMARVPQPALWARQGQRLAALSTNRHQSGLACGCCHIHNAAQRVSHTADG